MLGVSCWGSRLTCIRWPSMSSCCSWWMACTWQSCINANMCVKDLFLSWARKSTLCFRFQSLDPAHLSLQQLHFGYRWGGDRGGIGSRMRWREKTSSGRLVPQEGGWSHARGQEWVVIGNGSIHNVWSRFLMFPTTNTISVSSWLLYVWMLYTCFDLMMNNKCCYV